MLRSLARGMVVCVVSFLPVVLAWLAMLVFVANDAATSSAVRTPNPAKMPAYLYNPADVLVSVDPWFAAKLIYWIVPWVGGDHHCFRDHNCCI